MNHEAVSLEAHTAATASVVGSAVPESVLLAGGASVRLCGSL